MQKISEHSPVVVVGGGIIGLSTAYYLSLARKSGRSITVLDSASVLFAGASGKANGMLGDYGFKPEADSLGKLSWNLHRQLARMHKGRAVWGYREVMVYKLQRPTYSNASEGVLGSMYPVAPLPTWYRDLGRHASILVSSHEHAARMLVSPMPAKYPQLIIGSNPVDFCKFLQKKCEEMGVQILLDTTITSVEVTHGSLKSVTIACNKKRGTLDCRSLVIAAGPWSESVLSGLFPDSRVRIPSNKQSSSGNYMIVKVPGWDGTQDTRVCHQIYLEDLFGLKVDISSRPDGTLYIGGTLSAQEELPETSTDVRPQPKYVREMKKLVESVLRCSSDDIEILETGRAYRPCLEHGRPIVARIPLDDLLGMRYRDRTEGREVEQGGGVYLNVGHGFDGITLGPGSGKVMSELIERGESLSADTLELQIS